MIRDFRCKDTQRLFERRPTRRFPRALHRAALRKLLVLDAAVSLGELRVPPSHRLEKLRGDRKGSYSIRINDPWRICFRWSGNDALAVEIVDYH